MLMRHIYLHSCSILISCVVGIACKKPAKQTPEAPSSVQAIDIASTSPGPATSSAAVAGSVKVATELDALSLLPMGEKQRAVLCARPGRSKVHTVFCGSTPPVIKGLVDLQASLGLAFANPTLTGQGNNGKGGNPAFALAGHSSSLVARFTSAINPRAIIFTPPAGQTNPNPGQLIPDPNFVALGFLRGEQFAEIAAAEPDGKAVSFFLVRFEQACNALPQGCTPGDLLTPAVEKNWTSVTVYEDEDLKNTIFDCRQCHQPGGPGTAKILRMQERRNPWTHFMRDNRPGGQALLADFQAAHGTTEDYAGIPAALIFSSDPAKLEALVENNGFASQPNEFISGTIETEIKASSAAQPIDNSTPGTSSTWQGLYAKFVAGDVIATPYHDVKVSDPAKLAKMTAAYRSFLSGSAPSDSLPDIREVFLDAKKPEMGFGVKPGLDGLGILANGCKQCHNSLLDQSLSRAKFNVDLTKMDRKEKDLAIERLRLPEHDPKRMPPRRFRDLTAGEIEVLAGLLRQ